MTLYSKIKMRDKVKIVFLHVSVLEKLKTCVVKLTHSVYKSG